jgi:uncharacterized protein (UPF0335 family)
MVQVLSTCSQKENMAAKHGIKEIIERIERVKSDHL